MQFIVVLTLQRCCDCHDGRLLLQPALVVEPRLSEVFGLIPGSFLEENRDFSQQECTTLLDSPFRVFLTVFKVSVIPVTLVDGQTLIDQREHAFSIA